MQYERNCWLLQIYYETLAACQVVIQFLNKLYSKTFITESLT